MRKLFRFKYEPCNGTCYAWCDVLPGELNKLDPNERKFIIELMVLAHNKLCDNPEYSFGVDMKDEEQLFVAHFRTPDSTEVYANNNFVNCVKEVCKKVLSTSIPQVSGVCNYGDNGAENLGAEILKACVDEIYRKDKHDNCVCKVS